MPFVLMEMTPYHVDLCAELERRCFSDPWSEAMLDGECNNPLAHYYTVMDGLTVCGYGGYLAICDVGEITRIAVADNYRRKGIGRMLLNKIVENARELCLNEITLEVRESNLPAGALYESAGFRTIAKRPAYYKNPAEDALIMALNLKNC